MRVGCELLGLARRNFECLVFGASGFLKGCHEGGGFGLGGIVDDFGLAQFFARSCGNDTITFFKSGDHRWWTIDRSGHAGDLKRHLPGFVCVYRLNERNAEQQRKREGQFPHDASLPATWMP